MTEWQYRTVTAKWSRTRYVMPDFEGLFEAVMRGDQDPADDTGEIELHKGLDYMGRDGWELVSAVPNPKNWFTEPKSATLLLKRPTQEKPPTRGRRTGKTSTGRSNGGGTVSRDAGPLTPDGS